MTMMVIVMTMVMHDDAGDYGGEDDDDGDEDEGDEHDNA